MNTYSKLMLKAWKRKLKINLLFVKWNDIVEISKTGDQNISQKITAVEKIKFLHQSKKSSNSKILPYDIFKKLTGNTNDIRIYFRAYKT